LIADCDRAESDKRCAEDALSQASSDHEAQMASIERTLRDLRIHIKVKEEMVRDAEAERQE
jgi:hypothetical protein